MSLLFETKRKCVSTSDLDKKCSEKDILFSETDCAGFYGSWCCFDKTDDDDSKRVLPPGPTEPDMFSVLNGMNH